jgi:hypothetical protein
VPKNPDIHFYKISLLKTRALICQKLQKPVFLYSIETRGFSRETSENAEKQSQKMQRLANLESEDLKHKHKV